jgi:hypothetical protein
MTIRVGSFMNKRVKFVDSKTGSIALSVEVRWGFQSPKSDRNGTRNGGAEARKNDALKVN